MVWSYTAQGGEYPRGKGQTKASKGKEETKKQPPPLSPPTLWLCLRICVDELVLAASVAASPAARMNSNRGKLWIYCCVFFFFFWAGGGAAKVKLESFICVCVCVFWVSGGHGSCICGFRWRLPELDTVSRDCRSQNCGKFFNPPPPPLPPPPHLLVLLLFLLCSGCSQKQTS